MGCKPQQSKDGILWASAQADGLNDCEGGTKPFDSVLRKERRACYCQQPVGLWAGRARKQMKHRIPGLLLAGLMVCSMVTSAFADEAPATSPEASPSAETSTTQDANKTGDAGNSVSTAYPISIQYPTEEGGVITRTYEVQSKDEIALLPREDMTYQGHVYQFQDISVEEIPFHDEKPYVEVVTGESSSKDADTIIATLEPQHEFTTEDGYTGTLTLDKNSLSTEVTGYGYSSKTKSVTKTYTGLADQDLAYIPKTVTEGGVTYSLTDVSWSTNSNYNPYDPDIGPRYNANAVYSGKYTTSYAKGYTYEIQYTGNLVKDEVQGYRCTVIFAPVIEESHWYDVFVGENASPVAIVMAVILGILLVAGIAYAIYYLVKRNKGEEQVVTTEEYYTGDDSEPQQ